MSAATTCKVFIGSIPHCVTEEHLRQEASQHGTVSQLFYMQDQTQQTRGWAFITYSTREEAVRAINAMDAKLQFPGADRPVEARFANQKPPNPTPGAMCPVAPRPPSCWQQYFSCEGHPYYYNTMTGVTQWERPPELDAPAPSMTQRAEGASSSFGPPGSNLFVFHIPSDWNDVDLIQHFQHFGNIISARVSRDCTGRNRGFGFVSFDNKAASCNAIRGMNGFCVSGKYLKVQLKKGEEHHLPPGILTGGAGAPSPHQFGGMGVPNGGPVRFAPY